MVGIKKAPVSRALATDETRWTEQVIMAVAAHGLESQLTLPSAPADNDDFTKILEAAEKHRVLGLLAVAIEQGAFAVTDEQHGRVAEREQEWAVQALLVERLLVQVADLFDEAGLPYRVFKGPALARTAYDEPRMRVFADIDLIVPGSQFDRARLMLGDRLEATQWLPELRPGFDREFGKEALLRVGGREIDLHRTFVGGPIGLTIPLEELFASTATFRLGGRDVPTLDPVPTVVQTCINAAVGDFPPRAISLRDVAQLAGVFRVERGEVMNTANRWGARLALHRALRLASTELGLDPADLPNDGAEYRAPWAERVGFRSYLTPGRGYTRPAASLLVIRGVGPRLRYARAILSPQKSYRQTRRWGRGRHAQRAWQRLRANR